MKAYINSVLFGILLFNGLIMAEAESLLKTKSDIPDEWYQKSLEISLQVWGDLDMLCRSNNDMLPDHTQLVIDSAVGRLVYLDWCLQRLLKESRGPIDSQEISYLVRLVYALDDVYDCALQQDGTGRIESAQPVLRSIKHRMDSLLENPELFDTNHAFATPSQYKARSPYLLNPVKGLWYCGCRII